MSTATRFKGAIFDLDGVITATARVHALAWENMFNDFLEEYAREQDIPFQPFDKYDDYSKFVDGKPRYEGVKAFLASRGVKLPYGESGDAPDVRTVCGLGNRKNFLFQEILRRDGPEVFETSVELIKSLKANDIRVAVATSSRNCDLVLELAGLDRLFEARVDGIVSERLRLRGKPDPDIFVTAAREVGLLPDECMVVEDAISGVQAGEAGNFGLVLGVARNIEGELLRRFGADIVVQDLGEIDYADIEQWFAEGVEDVGWKHGYVGLDPGDEKLRETLTTVGNGYIGTRGCFEGEREAFNFYPGTYIAGIFNTLPSEVHGRTVYNDDMVNCPNWLPVDISVGNSPFQSPLSMELLSYFQTLNMKKGLMQRTVICRDALGRITRIHSKRLASMHNPHVLALSYGVTPLNYSGKITLRSSLDGNVCNHGVARYRELNSRHLEYVASGETGQGIFLRMQTNVSGYGIVMCARNRIMAHGKEVDLPRRTTRDNACICELLTLNVRENETCILEKFVSVHTTRDRKVARVKAGGRASGGLEQPGDPFMECVRDLQEVKSFKGIKCTHVRAWKKYWDMAGFTIEGDRFVQKAIRLHIHHLLVTASSHNMHIDAGMPARGLHGEAYRGHIFWDELYILPFFDLNFPHISRALLMYRYRRLDQARQLAREAGFAGAMYPWQSGDSGREDTQEVHYNPESGEWGPDLSRNQRHVSIAVFYNVWRYVADTGDKAFLRDCGAEMMLEIARFWASIARYDADVDRYHIEGVMGPDEFHEKLPGSDTPGLRDNAYTNVMVVWLLERTLEMLDDLPSATRKRLVEKTGFTNAETGTWKDMTRKLNVIVRSDGVISQFDGYMDLKELDWEDYRKRYYSIQRMDRILKAEGDSPDNYKVAKQADVLMLFYVLHPDEVARILRQLDVCEVGDPLDLVRINYAYYEPRTSHGSTLSKVVHCVVSSYISGAGGPAWSWFKEAMQSDVLDTQGGTTIEGIHTGVMAGTYSVIKRTFAGINLQGSIPEINPRLPSHWRRLAFRFCHRRNVVAIDVRPDRLFLTVENEGNGEIPVRVEGGEYMLVPGRTMEIALT
jgi:beta-phosphoglucomutase family hydrolase